MPQSSSENRTAQTCPTPLVGSDFRVVPGTNKRLVVFHNATGAKPHSFNFSKIAASLRCSVIFLNDPARNWYQFGVPGFSASIDETVDRIKDWAEVLGASKIITVGSSMGGYGALLHGTRLDANICAFAPEVVLRLPESRSAKMMPRESTVVVPDLTDDIREHTQRTTVFIGEDDPTDVLCGNFIFDGANVELLSIPGADHTVARHLLNLGLLESVLNAVIHNKPLPVLPERGQASYLGPFADLQHKTFLAYVRRDYEEALRCGLAALDVYPLSGFCHIHVTNALLKLKRPQEALAKAARAVAFFPDNPDMRYGFARTLRLCGQIDSAIALHRRTLNVHPAHARTHYDLGLALTSARQKSEALQHFEAAWRIEPDNSNYAARVKKFGSAELP